MVEFSLFYSGKVHFWVYLCHLGLNIFRSGTPYAVDFTLSFDTSFAPIEALPDVRTSTFTAKTVFLKILIFLFSHTIWTSFWIVFTFAGSVRNVWNDVNMYIYI